MTDRPRTPYFRPPSDYEAPKCACCDGVAYFHPVISGFKWSHVGHDPGHAVVLDHAWWDTATGLWHDADDVVLLTPQEPQAGVARG